MKTLLFTVDMQNDFCSPNGSLYIPGAEKDATRLSELIKRKGAMINSIILTQDNHQIMDIAHPGFWVDSKGNHPNVFTNITFNDIKTNKWKPVIFEQEAINYLKKVEQTEEYMHTIWPEHCIWGSEGAAIFPRLMDSVKDWARQGRMFEVVSKGTYPLTEHFGAFRANIPVEGIAETLFNKELVEKLNTHDEIWIAGEAKSHCVANTIKQLFDYPKIIRKTILLEDCMSNVVGSDELALSIYEKALEMKLRFAQSTQL